MSVVYFLILVGVLVVIHELGHFIAAKLLDFKVTRFSIGFGRPLVRVRGGETEYQLALFPLGGYVRILGEDPTDVVPESERSRSFTVKPLWQRLVVVFAGPAANLLLPVLIYFVLFAGHTELPAAVVGDILVDSPADRAGLEPGDRILAVAGDEVRYWEDVERAIQENVGKELRIKLQRGERKLERYIVPIETVVRRRDGQAVRKGQIGITRDPFLPQIGVVDPMSPAGRAGLRTGDVIISVNGEEIHSWAKLRVALSGPARRMNIAYFRGSEVPGIGNVKLLEADLAEVVSETVVGKDGTITVVHGIDSAEMFVAHVEPGSPADVAGLRPGDQITNLDGEIMFHWLMLDQRLQSRPEHTWTISWLRPTENGSEPIRAKVTQVPRIVRDEYGSNQELLVFGAINNFERGRGEMASIEGRLGYAVTRAVERTGETIGVMASGFLSVLRGRSPSDDIGGPLTMFRVASVSGSKGWEAFLLMIALVSVSVGLINLLPIPVLDGGHILVFAIEAIRRRPLSIRTRDRINVAGLALVGLISVLALSNDVIRFILN